MKRTLNQNVHFHLITWPVLIRTFHSFELFSPQFLCSFCTHFIRAPPDAVPLAIRIHKYHIPHYTLNQAFNNHFFATLCMYCSWFQITLPRFNHTHTYSAYHFCICNKRMKSVDSKQGKEVKRTIESNSIRIVLLFLAKSQQKYINFHLRSSRWSGNIE